MQPTDESDTAADGLSNESFSATAGYSDRGGDTQWTVEEATQCRPQNTHITESVVN